MKTIRIMLKRAVSPIKDFWLPALVVYAGLSFTFLMAGILTRSSDYLRHDCDSELRRVELIIPFFRVGCWLGGPLE